MPTFADPSRVQWISVSFFIQVLENQGYADSAGKVKSLSTKILETIGPETLLQFNEKSKSKSNGTKNKVFVDTKTVNATLAVKSTELTPSLNQLGGIVKKHFEQVSQNPRTSANFQLVTLLTWVIIDHLVLTTKQGAK